MTVINHAAYRINTSKKCVTRTFDIGWGNKVPIPILRMLKRLKVRQATFFLSAPWVKKNPHTARLVRKMGYEIGSHGYLHESYTEHGMGWIGQQVRLARII